MLVDVIFDRQQSAYVCVEVPHDATTEPVEAAAKRKLRDEDWMEDHNGILKMEVVEPSL